MSRQGNKFACAITALESYYIAYVTQGTGLSKKKKGNCSTAVNKYCFITIGQWWLTMKMPVRKTTFTARLTIVYEFHWHRIKSENEKFRFELDRGLRLKP